MPSEKCNAGFIGPKESLSASNESQIPCSCGEGRGSGNRGGGGRGAELDCVIFRRGTHKQKKEEKKKRKKVGGFETRNGELAALHSSVGVDNVNVNGHFREGRRRGRGRGVPI